MFAQNRIAVAVFVLIGSLPFISAQSAFADSGNVGLRLVCSSHYRLNGHKVAGPSFVADLHKDGEIDGMTSHENHADDDNIEIELNVYPGQPCDLLIFQSKQTIEQLTPGAMSGEGEIAHVELTPEKPLDYTSPLKLDGLNNSRIDLVNVRCEIQ